MLFFLVCVCVCVRVCVCVCYIDRKSEYSIGDRFKLMQD